jgi:transcription elongation regulator 1
MSDDDDDRRSKSVEKEREKEVKEEKNNKEPEEENINGSASANGDAKKDSDSDSEVADKPEQTEAEKEKEERVAAALAARQEAVKADMAPHLRDRDKERESHLHTEAVNAFSALLADLIRAPDFSWKEAKKMLKKDARYEALTGGESALDKSERERLFDTHIDELIAKKKTAFRSLLDEQKDVALDAAFKVSGGGL